MPPKGKVSNGLNIGTVLHNCPKFKAKDEGWGKSIDWDKNEVPLNTERHRVCPYCGGDLKDEKTVSNEDLAKLQSGGLRRRGRGFGQ